MWPKVIEKLEARLEAAKKPQESVVSLISDQLAGVTLHAYQEEGLRWLMHRDAASLNPIVGDEMGLGKTLQTIAFMCYLVSTKVLSSPCLVVAPLSVLPNWEEQLARFAPHLALVTYTGTKDERTATAAKIASTSPHVVLTSYELVLHDIGFFRAKPWVLGVFDEGHRLKNPKGKLYRALVDEITFERKLLLTGTPVQNNMEELAALLSFLNPAVFSEDVTERFRQETLPQPTLRALLAPLVLLRTVADVESTLNLPPLTKVVVHTQMAPMQRAYYKDIVSGGSAVSLMNVLAQLRKACNHPYLFPNAEPEPFSEGPHLHENSGKLHVLHALLPELRARGHVVLLFSTSTAFLDIIQDYCTMAQLSYERLDGSVRGEERWQTIDRFRKQDNTFLFLLSTRAGGVGLNLQRADTVIFCDVDYNPQMELQALARAYRMGQTKPIHVLHLVCQHSVEELIYKRALAKLELSHKVREASKLHLAEADGQPACLDGLDANAVLAYGLHHLLENSDDALVPLSPAEIAALLDRSTPTTTVEPVALDEVAVDSMYHFEGTDYSGQDAVCLAQLQAIAPKATGRKKKLVVHYEDDGADRDAEETAEERAAREQAARAKKLALWHKHGYTSHVAAAPTEDELEPEESSLELQYLSGNAATVAPGDGCPVVIVHCVDTSGAWTPRGFFGALSSRSPLPEAVYAMAKKCADLKLGQAHCIPVEPGVFVCLLVVQSSTRSKLKLRTAKTLAFRLNALQESLAGLAAFAKAHNAQVHMPRLGAGTPGFNWYAVERLVKKHLVRQGVATHVYYFAPMHKKAKAAPPQSLSSQ
ncbi:chromodomain-helicase-DNA-binding protein 1 [Achlya hypogyna]|uniref:Chromodomain-helicase-DNA-binding protein 1 n=1 Tax=Achlya hypogyna TaxID=1202772 RepID=A0A1V9ZDI1_ACHHY|nr:chromodomain-helicase-DNA-binding protein 1 [Achlya hypogyna]